MPTTTPALIRAQVAAVLAKADCPDVIGINTTGPVEFGDSLILDGRTLPVAYSDSVLAIRDWLGSDGHDEKPLVLLTPLTEMELGADVVARLVHRHLYSIEPWQLVKQRFQARWVDPRLVERHGWVATKLLESEPAGGYPPTPSGFLEAEMAWRFLFESMLGLPQGLRDPVSLLEWSVDAEPQTRLTSLEDSERADLASAVEETAGELARRIFDCIAEERGVSALALGLVARVLFGESAQGDVDAAKAAVRLERYVGGRPLPDKLAADWAEAAETVVRRIIDRDGLPAARPLLDEADALLRDELHAEGCAHRSATLQLGYEQRLERFATELEATVHDGTTELSPGLWDALTRAQEHVLAAPESRRSRRMRMAVRLASWLTEQRSASTNRAGSFWEAASDYRCDAGFADWARAVVWDGDAHPALSAAYARLSEAVTSQRESFNERFGALLANWTSTGSHDERVIPVENVLDRIVAPLAAEQPVLLAVIDGMGMAVFRELERDLVGQGWISLAPEGNSSLPPVISAVPSVTEVSRTSLLSGRLTSGNQSQEAKAFPEHPGILGAGQPSKPPILFHKGDLTQPGQPGLSKSVVEALTDPKQRVVGVVVNAIDDHLAKGDQVGAPWSVDNIRPLDGVLSAAIQAYRLVIFVSDHGHIHDHHTELLPGGEAERWRHVDTEPREPRAGELLIEGPRVVLGKDGRLIAPWSERIRFTSKKNGYHGGLSPQEVVIPLGVYSARGAVPEGWMETPRELPSWWERELPAPAASDAPPTTRPPAKRRKSQPSAGQGDLFRAPEEQVASPEAPAPTASWIDELLATELMREQRNKFARTSLTDDRIEAVLQSLDERGGKLTRTALANRLGLPLMRVGGVLSALRRVLNVDGYAVLSVDESSDTVELNRDLLGVQFGLSSQGTS